MNSSVHKQTEIGENGFDIFLSTLANQSFKIHLNPAGDA
jgi:hypothetical protein